MRGLNRRNNALRAGQIFKCLYRFLVGNRHVLRAAGVKQHGVLRTDARIVQTGGNRVNRCNLTVFVLTEVRLHAVEDTQTAGGQGGSGLLGVDAASGSLAADELNALVLNEVVEGADGVGTAADTSNDGVRQTAFLLQNLLLDFLGNHSLKVTNDGRERMRTHDGAENIVRVLNAADPLAEGLGNGILQGCGAAVDRMHLGAQQLHAVDVERLTLGVQTPHVHFAFQTEQSGSGCGCNAVLTGAGLRDNTGLAHLLGEQALCQRVVDFVGTGMIEILALEINLCAAQILGHLVCIVQQGRTADIVFEQLIQLRMECRIVFIIIVRFFQFVDSIHQSFGDVLSAVNAESSF